jgi:hypothetical protein
MSMFVAGDEDNRGGVVIVSSRRSSAPNRLDENSDLRGVTSCGLLSMWKFWDKSAARLPAGDEP